MTTRPRKSPKTRTRVEDDDEDEPITSSTCVVPDGYSLVRSEILEALVAGQHAAEDHSSKRADHDAKMAEANFIGLHNTTAEQFSQLQKTFTLVNEAYAKNKDQQNEIRERDAKISAMERQSEEARLERERVVAALRSKELDLKAKEMDLVADRSKFAETLKLVAPLMDGGGRALEGLIKQYVLTKFTGGIGGSVGLPAAGMPAAKGAGPAGAGGAPRRMAYTVSLDEIEQWHALVYNGFAALKPETAALLRALIATSFSDANGPQISKEAVLGAIQADIGDEAALNFLTLTGKAWTEVPADQTTSVGANGTSANGANSPN